MLRCKTSLGQYHVTFTQQLLRYYVKLSRYFTISCSEEEEKKATTKRDGEREEGESEQQQRAEECTDLKHFPLATAGGRTMEIKIFSARQQLVFGLHLALITFHLLRLDVLLLPVEAPPSRSDLLLISCGKDCHSSPSPSSSEDHMSLIL